MHKFFQIVLIAVFSLLMSQAAQADLAPGPEDPCYNKQEGESCVVAANQKSGVCVKSCFERRIDDKRSYNSCTKSCHEKKSDHQTKTNSK